jgi:hypothetical protein
MVYQLPNDRARASEQQANVVSSGFKQQIAQRPWTALGLSLAAGYALGSVVGAADTEEDQRTAAIALAYSGASYGAGTAPYQPAQPKRPAAAAHDGDGARQSAITNRAEPHQSGSNLLGKIVDQFDDQLSTLAGTAGSALLGLIHETIKQDAPELYRQIEQARRERALGAPEASRFDM